MASAPADFLHFVATAASYASAVALVAAGIAKLAGGESAAAVRALRLPDRVVPLAARVLPPAEIVGGVAAIVPATAATARIAVFGFLLFAFFAALRRLGRRNVACRCFGGLVPDETPRAVAVRNLVLAAAAGAGVWAATVGTVDFSGSALAVAIAALVQAAILVHWLALRDTIAWEVANQSHWLADRARFQQSARGAR